MKIHGRRAACLLAALCALMLASCSAEGRTGAGAPAADTAGRMPEQTQSLNTPRPRPSEKDAEPSDKAPPEDDVPEGGSPGEASPPDGAQDPDPAEGEGHDEAEPAPAVTDETLVELADYIPSVFVELKYATEDNFTGQAIYDFTNARLRYGTVKKLAEVQEELAGLGLGLKIWDAFRPTDAQFALWDVCPDSRYVANPEKGYSGHSRGNTVDLTLVSLDGTELEMPSGFDDFSALADRDYSDVSDRAAENAGLLEELMTAHGFKPYSAEWWHYSDETGYPVVTEE